MKEVEFITYQKHKVKLPPYLSFDSDGGVSYIAPLEKYFSYTYIEYAFDINGKYVYLIKVDTKALTGTGFYMSLIRKVYDENMDVCDITYYDDDIVEMDKIASKLDEYVEKIKKLEKRK